MSCVQLASDMCYQGQHFCQIIIGVSQLILHGYISDTSALTKCCICVNSITADSSLISRINEIPESYFVSFTFVQSYQPYLFIYFQERKQFVNDLDRHKEALKRLSDEVEKLKTLVGNLPEVHDLKKGIFVQLN